jgi:hypothetical protein
MSRVCTIIMGINLNCVLILMAGTSVFVHTVPELTAYVDVKQITGSLLVFQLDCGRFPSEREGLSVYTRRPADIPESKWERLGNVPTQDPWGHPYVYRFPGSTIETRSTCTLSARTEFPRAVGATVMTSIIGMLP